MKRMAPYRGHWHIPAGIYERFRDGAWVRVDKVRDGRVLYRAGEYPSAPARWLSVAVADFVRLMAAEGFSGVVS